MLSFLPFGGAPRGLVYSFHVNLPVLNELVEFHPFVHSFGVAEFSIYYVPRMTWKYRDERQDFCLQKCCRLIHQE